MNRELLEEIKKLIEPMRWTASYNDWCQTPINEALKLIEQELAKPEDSEWKGRIR